MAVEVNHALWNDGLVSEQPTPSPQPAQMEFQSLESLLPTIDEASRDILNEWLMQRGAPAFHIGEQQFELRWLETTPGEFPLVIEVSVGAHHALLALDGLAALDPLLVGEPFMLMPEALRDLAIQRLVARGLMRAPDALSEALEVRAVHWRAPPLPDWGCRLPFVLKRIPENTQLIGCLMFESASALQWLHTVLPVDVSSAQASLRLPMHLRLSLGRSILSTQALRELEVGDVVWIESASIARDGLSIELTAPCNRYSWRCRVRQRSLRIVAQGVSGATSHTSFAQPTPQASARPILAGVPTMQSQRWQLEVPVTFDLGELHLKTSDLELLQPGHIIELQQDVGTIAVSLRVGERMVARGTLVAIGKKLGVRVGTILAQPESATPTSQ